MVFYHRTDAAEVILREGFRDGSYMIDGFAFDGVFISDQPLDCNEGAKGWQLLQVTLPDDCCDFSFYELVEERRPYRGWCLPADVINRFGSVRLLSEEEENALLALASLVEKLADRRLD